MTATALSAGNPAGAATRRRAGRLPRYGARASEPASAGRRARGRGARGRAVRQHDAVERRCGHGLTQPDRREIRRELTQLKHLAAGADLPVGVVGRVLPDGRGVAPQGAPQIVRDVIRAGNVIAKTPYLWGGGTRQLVGIGL